MSASQSMPAVRLILLGCWAVCLQLAAMNVLARAEYSALGELTVTIQSAPGIEATAYGQEDGSDATFTGTASATATPFYDPDEPTQLGTGETLTVRSAVDGSADDGEASSFLFSEAVVELFNPTAAPVTVQLAFSYQVLATATAETPAFEDAFATAEIDVADDGGTISELWIASADGRNGPFSDGDADSGTWSITVAPGDTNVVTISGLVDSQGGAVGVGSTYALISDFGASAQDGALLVEWETSAELRTLGFHLERRGLGDRAYQRVNDELLLGLMGAPNGGYYSYLDTTATPGRRYTYRLVEIETNGREQVYGPYTVRVRRERAGSRAARTAAPVAASRMALPAALPSQGDPSAARKGQGAAVPDPGLPGYQRRPKPPTGGPRAGAGSTDVEAPLQLNSIEPATMRLAPAAMMQALDAPGPQTRVKVLIGDSGIYEITAEALATALNQPLSHVKGELRARRVRLTRYALVTTGEPRVEQEVAWQQLRRGDGLRFFAQALGALEDGNLYSDVNVYWLEIGVAGTTMRSAMGLPPRDAADAGEVYQTTVTWEENRSPLPFSSDDPDEDFWLWKMIYKAPTTGFSALLPDTDAGDEALLTPDASATGMATLRVSLKGGSETNGSAADHHFVVSVNGTPVGGGDPQTQWQWSGLDWFTAEIPVDQSLLNPDATNTIEVDGVLLDGVAYSVFWVDKVELTYWRQYTAMEDSAAVPAGSADVVSVRGFSCAAPDLMVYDISDAAAPRYYRDRLLKRDEAGAVSFLPSGGSEHLALCAGALKTPELQAAASAEWLATDNDYDYLVLTPVELLEGADSHAAYRAGPDGGSYQTAVFTLDELYDNCNGGIVDASAIRDCLKYAYDNWQGPPTYVLFVGEGTIDPKDYLGIDENRFPVRECATLYGLYTCDNWFADFYDPLGNPQPDGLAEFMLGRVPVSTSAEMVAFSNKVAAYEANAVVGSGELLWTADNPDGAGSFHVDSDAAAAYAEGSGYSVDKIYFTFGDNATATRNSIKAALGLGPEMFHWVGHGAPGTLADEKLFRLTEAQQVTNARTTIFTALTCTVGYGAYPETESIVEALVVRPTAARPTDAADLTPGAVSAFAPTGESINYYASLMDQVFIDALYGLSDATTLGEAARAAIEAAPSDQNFGFMRDIYHVFGDPALVPWR